MDLKKIFSEMLTASKKGSMNIVSVVIGIALVVSLLPTIKFFIGSYNNGSASEVLLLGLITTFVIIGLIAWVVDATGVMHTNN